MNHIVSIRLSSDGHSFSILGLENAPQPTESAIQVEVLSPRSMLIPHTLYTKERSTELLTANGMAPKKGECIVSSDEQKDIINLMCVPEQALQQIQERFAENDPKVELHFSSPLLGIPTEMPTEATIYLHREAGLLYIKVYDVSLKFAEVIVAPTEADILLLVSRLREHLPLQKFILNLTYKQENLQEKKQLKKRLGKLFKKIICA